MVWVYILQSKSSGRFYVGVTERLETREAEHNSGQTKSTKGRGPWALAYTELYGDRSQAMKRELEIKRWKSHVAIEALVATSLR